MPTSITNLWDPDIWVAGLRERQATFPSLLNSGAVVANGVLDAIATGPGTSANAPFLKDSTDADDEIQVEDTAPTVDNILTSGLNVVTILNRVCQNSSTALAAQVSGQDPVSAIITTIAERRLKQRQKTALAMLRGLFGTAGARNGAGCLSAVRLGGTTAEPFTEDGANADDTQRISPDLFIDAKMLMGELSNELRNGVFWCHPNIRARLEKLDALNFKEGVPSALPFTVTTYRGVPIFESESLVRAGTTSGYVYDCYLLSRGVIGKGEKPQQGDVIDVASLQLDTDKGKNNEIIYDRTRFVMHVDGTKWGGTPAGQSATNAELQTVTNWTLVYSTANRVGGVAFRVNG